MSKEKRDKPLKPETSKRSRRNSLIETAAQRFIERVDYFVGSGQMNLPNSVHRRVCDKSLASQRASVRLAITFLMFYWLEDPSWDQNAIPTGIRGQYGDKWVSDQLSQRHVTFHENITAFAENLGWKGNVEGVRLKNDVRFRDFFAKVKDANEQERARIADYLAERYASSRRETVPLPPVGADVLTFARAKQLFHALVATPSEGFIQQFLIAALLHQFRLRQGIEVATRHPFAADRSDDAAGDIEERQEGRLIRAYEVTVRPDWKNRLSDFRSKMDRFSLSKYIIIASRINDDCEWAEPAKLILALDPYGRDIAVVDILDVVNFMAAELTPAELRAAVNKGFDYLGSRKLGNETWKHAYVNVVSDWLDSASEQ